MARELTVTREVMAVSGNEVVVKYSVTNTGTPVSPEHVFVVEDRPASLYPGQNRQEFLYVASRADLAAWPINAPVGNSRYYRVRTLEKVYSSAIAAAEEWAAIQRNIRTLLQDITRTDTLPASVETVVIAP